MKGKLEKIRVLNKKQSHINDYFVRIKFVWKILLADISFLNTSSCSNLSFLYLSLSKVTSMSSSYLEYLT